MDGNGHLIDTRNITLDLVKYGETTPDAPALILPGREITYRELNQLVWQAALDLYRAGVRAGDVVALHFARELPLAVAMLGVARLGATVYSISRNTTQTQRLELISAAGASMVVTDQGDQLYPGVPCLLFENRLPGNGVGDIDQSIAREEPEAPWLLISGSGTTGEPRLIAVTHGQQRARNGLVNHFLQVTPGDRSFHFSDLDFTSAKSRLCLILSSGAAFGLLPGNPGNPVDFLNRQGFSMVDITTFHVERLLALLPSGAVNLLPGVRIMGMTSATVSDDLRQRIRRVLCPNLCVVYGTNEMGIITAAMPPAVYSHSETVGIPPPGVEVQVMDAASGKPLPAETIGEIRTRSAGQVSGYRQGRQGEGNTFADGWFYPGDLGKFTVDGQLIHYGRADHMMIMNGINIYPAEIERVLLSHPAVQDAAAIPVRHRVHQDLPVCAVVLGDGAGHDGAGHSGSGHSGACRDDAGHEGNNVSEKDLQAYATERLGARGPRRVVILGQIPRNEQGKLQRAELREQILAALKRGDVQKDGTKRVQDPGPPQAAGRQLTFAVKFPFTMPAQPNLAGLDAWLNGVMENDLAQKIEGDYPGRARVPPVTRQWLWRCLQLARLLLRAARVPVFDPPQVLGCELSDSHRRLWVATAGFARLDDFPADMYHGAVTQAVKLAAWAAVQEPDGRNRAIFFKAIEDRFLVPFKGRLPAAKSIFWILEAAHRRGIPFRHAGGGTFQLGWGARGRLLERSTTEEDTAIGARLAQNKIHSARLLKAAGLPAAVNEAVADGEAALASARRLGWPVVIKPMDRDRGEGVTVDVVDATGLNTAFDRAQALSRLVIVERQVPGVCHRLFIARGKLLYGVKRLPMAVVGNGRNRVAELVAAEYARQQGRAPWLRSEIRPVDELAIAAMGKAGFSPDSVPGAGVSVPLRPIESTEWGGIDEDVSNRIHPENLRIALEAASLFGLGVAGIDIISTDISRPWFDNGAIINEVNFAPLLGGWEISRSHIPAFLADYIDGDGRIPVEVFAGGDAAWQAALARRQELVGEGVDCYLTSALHTLAPSGEKIPMAVDGLYHRVRALALNRKVAALVLAVQTDEFLGTGLPLEWIDSLTLVDQEFTSVAVQGQSLAANRRQVLAGLFESWKT